MSQHVQDFIHFMTGVLKNELRSEHIWAFSKAQQSHGSTTCSQSATQWMLGRDLHTAVLSVWLHGQYALRYYAIYLFIVDCFPL